LKKTEAEQAKEFEAYLASKLDKFITVWHDEIVDLDSLYMAEPMSFAEIERIYQEDMAKAEKRYANQKTMFEGIPAMRGEAPIHLLSDIEKRKRLAEEAPPFLDDD